MIVLELPTGDERFITGDKRGKEIRKMLDLDTRDKDKESYIVKVFEKVEDMSITFFISLFDGSVESMNMDKFMDKYTFEIDIKSLLEKVHKIIHIMYMDRVYIEKETGKPMSNKRKLNIQSKLLEISMAIDQYLI